MRCDYKRCKGQLEKITIGREKELVQWLFI